MITYSFDLGTNSIGWAVSNTKKVSILGSGVKIFPEGVENLGQGEKEISKNASRRENRNIRRQHFRRKFRKKTLLKVLISNNLAPQKGQAFEKWIKLNPYTLRSRAISEEITLHELGRIFYHLAQRRGFQSNSRSQASDNDDGAIYYGKPAEGKAGINETKEAIDNFSTLGEYLNSIYPQEGIPFEYHPKRIRNRYTTRAMYIQEFEAIWKEQQKYHPELTLGLKTNIGGRKKDGYTSDGVLFYQRPLRSQRHLVGKCTFEPTKPKAPVSCLPYEKFRAWQFINTISVNGESLTDQDRSRVFSLLMKKDKPKIREIRRAISKNDNSYQFNYEDDEKCPGSYTFSNLSSNKFFGKAWKQFTDEEKENIWRVRFDFEDKDKLKAYALENWNFNQQKADNIAKFNLKQGYAALSRKAINNILPFLEMGWQYDRAVALGGVKNAFGKEWFHLTTDQQKLMYDNIDDVINKKGAGEFIDDLKDFLRSEFNLNNKQLARLYHHSTNIKASELLPKLSVGKEADREINSIRNPVVITALFELRKLVNTMLEEYPKPDKIVVELGRHLKASKKRRSEIRRKQREEEELNSRIRNRLEEHEQAVTKENILKLKLWEECQHTCPYTGRSISFTQLFSQTGEIQIEHIQPYSRTLDNSFLNKTLCYADENRRKGDRTPFEFYQENGDWAEVRTRARTLFRRSSDYPDAYRKFERFISEELNDDFISRQLNDTRYISKEAAKYLSKICRKVRVVPGAATAKLRHYWGLNSILDTSVKNRADHRHHAIDAITLGFISQRYVEELAKWNQYQQNNHRLNFPKPSENFWGMVKESVEQILVVYKPKRKPVSSRIVKTKKQGRVYQNKSISVRGQLHKEFIYGKRKDLKGEVAFNKRIPINDLKKRGDIQKIADPGIRRVIETFLSDLGIDLSTDYTIPSGAFFRKNDDHNVTPLVYLSNRNGERVPIKTVRKRENIGNARNLKKDINQYVNPRNNEHLLIYINEQGEYKYEIISLWETAERLKQNQPMIQLPKEGIEIVCVIRENDLFLIPGKDKINSIDQFEASKCLYKVQNISGQPNIFINFRKHTDARPTKEAKQNYLRIQSLGTGKTGWLSHNPIKVRISQTGKIEQV